MHVMLDAKRTITNRLSIGRKTLLEAGAVLCRMFSNYISNMFVCSWSRSFYTKRLYTHTNNNDRFLVKEKGRPEDSAIGEGYPAPGLEVLKEFIRWYYHSTRGRLDERPTMRSTLLCAQRFCPGFFIATGSRISHEDKNELYSVRFYDRIAYLI